MNNGAQVNKDELLDTLEQMIPAQFAKLVFKLKVRKYLPSKDENQTERAIALLEWAEAPGGCGLEKIKQALEEMRIPLDKLHCPSKDRNHIYITAKKKLLTFNHETTLKVFNEIVSQLETRENAGIFILQDCLSKGVKYCRKRLINDLKDMTAVDKFKMKYIVDKNGYQTQEALLSNMARHLNIAHNLEQLTEKDIINIIIQKIDSSVPKTHGYIYLFYIKGYENLLQEKKFWNWFFDQFWSSLIQKLPRITENRPYLKLIFLFESLIAIEVEPNYICSYSEPFTRNKIVNLPLKTCDMEEIKKWLYNSDFPDEMIQKILYIINQKGTNLDKVYEVLQEELEEYLENDDNF